MSPLQTLAILCLASLAPAAIANPAALPQAAADSQRVTPGPVVAIVRVPTPWYAPKALVAHRMKNTVPQYQGLPGLVFKAYSFEKDSGDFGGVYLWQDRASAAAWFNEAWFARVRQERGQEGRVQLLEAPLTLVNQATTAVQSGSDSVVTVVSIAVPAGLDRARLLAGFRAAVPQYRAIDGLLRKSFTLEGEPGQAGASFGGVYLWRDEAAARAWFNAAWFERVRQTYGTDARLQWFTTPILLPRAQVAQALPSTQMINAPQP
jgi:heme-degrading monooxygenase HmoA